MQGFRTAIDREIRQCARSVDHSPPTSFLQMMGADKTTAEVSVAKNSS